MSSLWYTVPVVGPLSGSLSSRRRPVKNARTLGATPRAPVAPPAELTLIEPIKRTRLPDEIANRVRLMMLDGTFKPDRPLPSERTLARRFGVSRGSVRDAFRRLEVIGLLRTRHGQGTFPRELSVDNLVTPIASVLTLHRARREELIDVRRIFEPAVARMAASRVTADELGELETILAAQRRKVRARHSTIGEDTAFHSTLARATHNPVIVRIMETLNELLIASRTQTLEQRGRPLRSMRGHEAVLAALKRGDGEGAAEAMSTHLEQIAALLRGLDGGTRD